MIVPLLLSLGVAALLTLFGCNGPPQHINIISASISAGDSESHSRLSVRLRGEAVRALAEQEIYSHVVVFECDNEAVRYPISPRLGNTPMDDFSAVRDALRTPSGGQTVEIQGEILSSFLNRLTRVCVKMNGGGYLGGALTSNVVAIQQTP